MSQGKKAERVERYENALANYEAARSDYMALALYAPGSVNGTSGSPLLGLNEKERRELSRTREVAVQEAWWDFQAAERMTAEDIQPFPRKP